MRSKSHEKRASRIEGSDAIPERLGESGMNCAIQPVPLKDLHDFSLLEMRNYVFALQIIKTSIHCIESHLALSCPCSVDLMLSNAGTLLPTLSCTATFIGQREIPLSFAAYSWFCLEVKCTRVTPFGRINVT